MNKNRKGLMIKLVMPVSVWLFILVQTGPAMALSTNFSQQILPLDCIFTVENIGTQQLNYITPEACGVVLPSSGSGSSQSQGSGSSVQTGQTVTPSGYSGQPKATGLTSNSTTSGSLTYSLPNWSPIASISSPVKASYQSKNESSTSQTVAVVAAGSFLVFLFILAFFVI